MPNNQSKTKNKKTKKKVAKKARRKPGRPKGSTNIKKRTAVARKAKRRGRPVGIKKAGRRGRPVRSGKAAGKSIILPISNDNVAYWSQMLKFLKENRGSRFIIQMDGDQYSLRTE